MHDKSCYYLFCLRPHFTSCPFGFGVLRVYVCKSRFVLFFFWFQPYYLTKSTVNSARMHCSWVPQIPLFSHFFIKNGSYGTIHTFKNDFATMFSVLVFSFSKNKLNPNTPDMYKDSFFFIDECLLYTQGPIPMSKHKQRQLSPKLIDNKVMQ